MVIIYIILSYVSLYKYTSNIEIFEKNLYCIWTRTSIHFGQEHPYNNFPGSKIHFETELLYTFTIVNGQELPYNTLPGNNLCGIDFETITSIHLYVYFFLMIKFIITSFLFPSFIFKNYNTVQSQ